MIQAYVVSERSNRVLKEKKEKAESKAQQKLSKYIKYAESNIIYEANKGNKKAYVDLPKYSAYKEELAFLLISELIANGYGARYGERVTSGCSLVPTVKISWS